MWTTGVQGFDTLPYVLEVDLVGKLTHFPPLFVAMVYQSTGLEQLWQ